MRSIRIDLREVGWEGVEWTHLAQVEVFWVVTPCSVVAEYRRLRCSCCLHLQQEHLNLKSPPWKPQISHGCIWLRIGTSGGLLWTR